MSETTGSVLDLDEVVQENDFTFELADLGDSVVFVVDDDRSSCVLSAAILEGGGYRVRQFTAPDEALAELKACPPPILVTDFSMRGISGLELANVAQEHDPDVRIILLTGSGDETTAQAALRAGVFDYIKKPPEPQLLRRSVQRALHARASEQHHRAMVGWMKEELDRRARAIRDITVSSLTTLANALEMRDPHFRGHSKAVALQAAALAQTLGADESEIEAVRTAGLLHDVGMIAVPDRFVQKAESLTDEEYQVIRSHCDKGVEILQPMSHLGRSIRYVHEHHERWDGSGYPLGKQGDEISLGGQILAISEAWTAILEARSYRAGRSRDEGLEILQDKRGAWFSREITDALRAADVGMI